MVVACLALLVALGGTSIAAVNQLVPRNSVRAAQLQFGAVTNPKIRDNAVNSAKVANRSLRRSDSPWASFRRAHGPAGATRATRRRGCRGCRRPGGHDRSDHGPLAVGLDPGRDRRERRGEHCRSQSICAGNERAISGSTGWSGKPGLELWTGRLTPILNASNQVVGFLGTGGNDSGQASTFIVYSLCYTP